VYARYAANTRDPAREQLIGRLRDHLPYALPRVATAPAALPPGGQWPDLPHPDDAKPSDTHEVAPRTERG
jgi:hypothetical protein